MKKFLNSKWNMTGIVVALVVIISVAMSAPFSNYFGKQTVRLYNEFIFYNTSGTSLFALSNTGALTVSGTAQAKKDSFTVRNWNLTADSVSTAGVDTCLMTGASTSDVFSITQYTPPWNATPDTNVTYHYKVSTFGDTVFTQRTKNTATADLKSGGLYDIRKIDK